MQENQMPVNQSISLPAQAGNPVIQTEPQVTKSNNFLVILLSILLIISVCIAGFFAYQTQKLVAELQGIRSEELVTTKTTPELTTEPVATDIAVNQVENQINEETEVRSFADLYAKTYMTGDWTKLKTLLTSVVAKEMSAGMTNLQIGGYLLDGYKILSVVKESTGNYTVTIRFTQNGQPYKNPTGDPKIIVTKENGLWKSISWYLYQ